MSRIAESLNPNPYNGMPGYKRPGTSQEAAQAVSNGSAAVREQVYEAIKAAEPRGLTADEASAVVGRKPAYCRPRCSELVAAGRIAASGARRRNESSGLSATVYRVVP